MRRRYSSHMAATLGFFMAMAPISSQAAPIRYTFSTGTVAAASNTEIAALLGIDATVTGSLQAKRRVVAEGGQPLSAVWAGELETPRFHA